MSNDQHEADHHEAFVQLLTAEQLRLFRYITTLLGDQNEASNVLQETNLVLWRKAQEFQPGTNFSAWARKVAYWQTQAYVRDRRRDRHVFSEELVSQLASRPALESSESETRLALRHCLMDLSPRNRELLRQRYGTGLSIQALATHYGKKPSAMKVGLLRIRRALLKCIEKQLATES